MKIDASFRTRVARQLLNGESLPALTKRRAEAAGFRAFEPIETYLNSLDATFRERSKAREEEALEGLGVFAAPPYSPIVQSLYQSPFLDELRVDQHNTGAKYRRLSHDDEYSKLIGSNDLNTAFARGQEIMRREAQAAHEAAGLIERMGMSGLRAVLKHHLSQRGFNRASALERGSHLVYTKELPSMMLTFAFDTRRQLQHRFLISAKTSAPLDIFSRVDAIEIWLTSASFAKMANGRPYLTPENHVECDWSVELLCLAADLVMERLTA